MCTLNINPSFNLLVGDLPLHLQYVKYQGCVSSYQKSFIGAPQSTILWPLLWKIFINDLTPATNNLKYPDDTTVYHSIYTNNDMVTASTANTAMLKLLTDPLQEATTYAADWSSDNQMLLNTTKSSTITFTLKKSTSVEGSGGSGGEPLEHRLPPPSDAIFKKKLKKELGVVLHWLCQWSEL